MGVRSENLLRNYKVLINTVSIILTDPGNHLDLQDD